jgi:hypothetical protein
MCGPPVACRNICVFLKEMAYVAVSTSAMPERRSALSKKLRSPDFKWVAQLIFLGVIQEAKRFSQRE